MSLNFQDTLKKAEAGDIDAQYAIATAFFEGEEITEDYAQAINWFRKAAESGHAESAYRLGSMCLSGMGLKEDPSEAAKWFTKALAHGLESWHVGYDSERIGDAYYFGRSGVAIDYAEAFRWYRVAADAGVADLMVKVGMMYAAGEGVLKDDTEAARWYRKAANLGDWEGWYKLGMCYKDGVGVEKDSQEAEKWFLLAARKNHEDAQYALGLMLVAGVAVDDCGCDEEYWLGMAAEKGHVMAQFALGEIYESRARYASACAWYRIAELHGNAQAASRLQLLVPRMSQEDVLSGDIKHADLLVRFAKTAAWRASQALETAQRNHARALERLGDLHFCGRGVPKDYTKAFLQYREAAMQGSSMALHSAGVCCLNREEQYKSEIEAYAYFRLASTIHGLSRDELASLEQRMSHDDRARGQKIANMLKEEIEANKLGK